MKAAWKLLNGYMKLRCHEPPLDKKESSQHVKEEAKQGLSHFTVSAAQVPLVRYRNYKAYQKDVESYFIQAKQQGSQLICFPELFGMLPCMFIPGVRHMLFNKKQSDSTDGDELDIDLRRIVPSLSFYTCSLTLLSHLARKYQMFAATGSMMVSDQGKAVNRQYLIDDQGQILGHQDKLHLVDTERSLHLSPGEDLHVFDTKLGKIVIPICMDATYFETFKYAMAKGADLVILPIANMEPYQFYYALRGADMRVQEYPLYCIKSALVRGDSQIELSGKSTISAPLKRLSPNYILAQSKEAGGRCVISAEINLREEWEQAKPVNPAIEEKLYQEYKKRKRISE